MRLGDLLCGSNWSRKRTSPRRSNGRRWRVAVSAKTWWHRAIQQRSLDPSSIAFLPSPPILRLRLDDGDLLSLLMKLIYTGRLETNRQFVDAIKLPYTWYSTWCRCRRPQLLRTLGTNNSDSMVICAMCSPRRASTGPSTPWNAALYRACALHWNNLPSRSACRS